MSQLYDQPQCILLFTIEDVFEIKGRGWIVVPGIPDPSPTIPVLKRGASILLRRPDGSEIATAIRDVEIVRLGRKQTNSPIMLPTEIRKGEIPIGTEVWYFLQEGDVFGEVKKVVSRTFRQAIEAHCRNHQIEIPPGFGRNTPSPYVVIRHDLTPPKLIATTWFKQEDVIYYFEHSLLPGIGLEKVKAAEVLDFKTGRRLRYAESGRLIVEGNFHEIPDRD